MGGDAELELTYRFASAEERAWMNDRAVSLSELVDFRSMAVVGDERGLTQMKAVDAAYPLVGSVIIDDHGEVLGEGWHQAYGGPHAERNAGWAYSILRSLNRRSVRSAKTPL